LNDINLLYDDILVCYRNADLIYCGHNISASSLYQGYCVKTGWEEIKYSTIDFSKDNVFGFILDPLTRHKNGYYADLKNFTNSEQEYIFANGSKFFSSLAIFSHHNLPLYSIYKENLEKIDWIPLDLCNIGLNGSKIETVHHTKLFCKLLEHHNITPDVQLLNKLDSSSKKRNVENPNFKKIISEIEKNIYNKFGFGNSAMYVGLHRDFDVYQKVVKYTQHWNSTWDKISWVNNYRHEQMQVDTLLQVNMHDNAS
jgi:hypothetical protein